MIENVRHASLHPLHNIVGHEGSSHDYKQPVESTSVPKADVATTSSIRTSFSPLAITSGSQADQEIIEDGARPYSAKVLSSINYAKSHRLTELIPNGMGVERIPEMIGELTNLTSIDISGVQLLGSVYHLKKSKGLVDYFNFEFFHHSVEPLLRTILSCNYLFPISWFQEDTTIIELPGTIGQMKSLQELNFSNNHISILPLSFAMLTGLEKLEMNENPWVVPPLDVVKRGKEAVLKCMIDLVAQEAKVEEAAEKSGMSSRISSVFKKKKSPGSAYKVKQRNDLLIRA
uniref:Uncharacterized protein n=2 Tax=Physcomitrium patens TaxID=3218 RepID=A0A2K1JYC1_PHYPA|nr:hypothetical protein PHYPA_013645 [Physcomitrium patens]